MADVVLSGHISPTSSVAGGGIAHFPKLALCHQQHATIIYFSIIRIRLQMREKETKMEEEADGGEGGGEGGVL